jgi:hypothetical protein
MNDPSTPPSPMIQYIMDEVSHIDATSSLPHSPRIFMYTHHTTSYHLCTIAPSACVVTLLPHFPFPAPASTNHPSVITPPPPTTSRPRIPIAPPPLSEPAVRDRTLFTLQRTAVRSTILCLRCDISSAYSTIHQGDTEAASSRSDPSNYRASRATTDGRREAAVETLS